MTPVVRASNQPTIGTIRSIISTVTFIFCAFCCTSPMMLSVGLRTSSVKLLTRSKQRFVSSLTSRSSATQMGLSREGFNPDSFSTKVSIPPSAWKLDHSTPIHLVGSCFTDTISTALKKLKFNCYSNGQGIVFNPISITECLSNVLESKIFTENDVFRDPLNNDTFHSWNHHSSFSSMSVESMVKTMNSEIVAATNNLLAAKTLFITLGTARVHVLKENNKVVSNCHKQPSNLFEKKLLSVNEIVENLEKTFLECKKRNPDMKIVLTVSPVRHTREGMAENSLSKSTLICAVHTLIEKYPSYVFYFPSYEIFLDELRDYRWYGKDLIHPSEQAQQIIFEKFSNCFMSEKALQAVQKISSLQADMNHRPSENLKNSKAYVSHLKRTSQKIKNMQIEFEGYLDFSGEEISIQNQLALLDKIDEN